MTEQPKQRDRLRPTRKEVRIYGATIKTIARIMAAKSQTKTEVVRDALALYEAELIDNGTITLEERP